MQSKLTPMMKQYMEIKKKHQNEILFFRMGDFYEMFFDDAEVASGILNIALTSRQNSIPMCGIPFHAAESYIARLIRAGKRVAICEQMENVPSSGSIVKREVVRVITPGTVIESNLLQSDDHNYLASVIFHENEIGLSFVDISTGDFLLSTIEKKLELFRGELVKYSPSEIVLKESDDPEDEPYNNYIKNFKSSIYRINEWYYDEDFMKDVICEVFNTSSTRGLGIESYVEVLSCGSILQYLKETHRQSFKHLQHPRKLTTSDTMILDEATIRSLELLENQQDRTKKRTLFSILNHTKTAMGRRLLEYNILQPLIDPEKIDDRLNAVQYFHEYHEFAREISDSLKRIQDIERLLSRISLGRVLPANLLALRDSLNAAMHVKKELKARGNDRLKIVGSGIPDLKELSHRITDTITDEPALSPEQGRIIREGFNEELDKLYSLKKDAKDWVIEFQEQERKRLGISTLKVKYNRIHGYFIEVSKAQTSLVDDSYLRKQTLVGSERYTTDKLQKFETDILNAADKTVSIEKQILEELRIWISDQYYPLQETAKHIAETDFYVSLAVAAIEHNYIRPSVSDKGITRIQNARHPIVEVCYTKEVFVPNDINLDSDEHLISIITGPNMSGKSTYIRTAALVQLMAQTGSFVPASSAEIGIADRIFTRIGASDNISRGESTFLVEMNETANIINNATDRSLIIMDEIGRGTSTYDGMSIAWAVVEYILRYISARTLFATHYHELTELGNRKGIFNCTVMVKETLHGVDFLHRVVPGSADKSYGIHVARLAGLPGNIISRSQKILERLEKQNQKQWKKDKTEKNETQAEQLEIFNASNHRVIKALKDINCEEITPLQALNELNRLKKLIDN